MSRSRKRNYRPEFLPPSEVRRHFPRASVLWIYLPVCAGAILAAGLALGLIAGGGGSISGLAEVATVFLVGMLLLAGIAALVFMLGMAWGINWLIDIFPSYTGKLQSIVALLRYWAHRTSNAIAEPVISAAGWMAGIGSLIGIFRETLTEKKRRGANDGKKNSAV